MAILTRYLTISAIIATFFPTMFFAQRIRTDSGMVEGAKSADGKIQLFKGIPYAAPPIGDLRWKAPQPVTAWKGPRDAKAFTPRCMQGAIFSDMIFRDSGPSEDCLYLNVWTPAAKPDEKLPVMVWIYGGGFQAGAASEPRQDGEFLAHKGVVVVSMNYRLGVFGFFSHPDLTKESPNHASGNYGLLDQAAALQWVKKNIANFGGDPNSVTIFGESAGSFSVSAQMASPLSKNLIHRAIGESGAFFGQTLRAKPLAQSEQDGAKFAQEVGAATMAQLRALPAQQLLDAALKNDSYRFDPNIDGYFMPASPSQIYQKGDQAHIPLLAGWNRDEGNYKTFFGKTEPTKENYVALVHEKYGDQAEEILKLLPAENDEQMKHSADVLGSLQFIGFGTWKWLELQSKLAKVPIYRYEFDRELPVDPASELANRAYHSAEIEYVFGALESKKLNFAQEDFKLSELMGTYWTNFAKTGDPNGPGLPQWPQYKASSDFEVMHLAATSAVKPDSQRKLYETVDKAVQANLSKP